MKPLPVPSPIRAIHRWGRFAAARVALPAILAVVIVGCRPAAKQEQAPTPVVASPISASPNPVPAGSGQGTTTISWTGDGPTHEVYCSTNGAEEKRVWGPAGKTGSFDVTWINAGAVYEFRLYSGKERKELLGTVKVTKNKE